METINGILQAMMLAIDKDKPDWESLRAISSLYDESIYIVDYQRRCFLFVSDKGYFLGGRMPEEALKAGYDFYKEVIHPADYPLAVKMYQAIVRYFSRPDISLHDLAYVKFNIRINSNRGLMTEHKVTPLILNNHSQMAVCTVSPAMTKTSGNLFAYYRNQDVAYQYSLLSDQWKKEPLIKLNPREKRVLELSKVGMTRKDVAGTLCISMNTLRNVEASIYDKLNVHSMMQAVNSAANQRLMWITNNDNDREKPEEQSNGKKIRRKMTADKLLRVQEALNNGQSANSIAKQENISEFTIRYAKKTGKLN